MEAPAELHNSILRITQKLLEKNGGDVTSLYEQRFLFDNGNVVLSYSEGDNGDIKASYDYCGKIMDTVLPFDFI
jgi:hypothetical protein